MTNSLSKNVFFSLSPQNKVFLLRERGQTNLPSAPTDLICEHVSEAYLREGKWTIVLQPYYFLSVSKVD